MTQFNKNVNQQYIHTKIYSQDHVFSTTGALYTGCFFTGPALKVLCMELVPSNKEIDWFRHKSSKYGTSPTQEKKMTGSAQHIEGSSACNNLIHWKAFLDAESPLAQTIRVYPRCPQA